MLGPLIKNAPVIGSCYGFATATIDNSTTSTGEIKTVVKCVVIQCVSPLIKYPALCAALAACSVTRFVTDGNPSVVSATVIVSEAIVESTL